MKIIALVGRPNVGKSTLFNRLTRTRDALVADFPGLTRDRKYGRAQFAGCEYIVIDTGGIALTDIQSADVAGRMADQALQAVAEADLVLFMVDARAGLLPGDLQVAEHIRLAGRPCAVVANKCDGLDPYLAGNEFYELGLGEVYQIAAAHGRGVSVLVEEVIAPLLIAPASSHAASDVQDVPDAGTPEDTDAEARSVIPPAGTGGDGDAGWERGFAFLDDVPHEQRGGGFDWYAFRQRQRERRSLMESPDHGGQPFVPFADLPVKFAIVGKPNVGKSTLTNRLLGEERVVVADLPGTTRDAIHIPVCRNGRNYIVIDTAGVRRRGRVSEAVEKFSIVKTLRAIEDCNVAVLLMDAHEPLSDQDLSLLGFIIDAGRALVIAVNKWDGLTDPERQRWRQELERRLGFADFVRVHFISALHGSGVGHLYASIDEAYASATLRHSSAHLNRLLQQALTEHRPPLCGGRRIRLKYAHAGGYNPPRIIIHGTRVNRLPESYRRYLGNFYRRALQIMGTPLSMEFREGENPYARPQQPLRRPTQSQRRAQERDMREQRHYRRAALRAAARQRHGQH